MRRDEMRREERKFYTNLRQQELVGGFAIVQIGLGGGKDDGTVQTCEG
jgi:hypothetical protein